MKRLHPVALALLLASCGGDDAKPRATLELSFASFGVYSLFFAPRTAGPDEEPFSLVITGAEREQACQDPAAIPSGTRQILVTLKPGEDGWPSFPSVCAIGDDLVNCSAQVAIYEQKGGDRLQWFATSGVVIVHERAEARVAVELQVDVAESPRVCTGSRCVCKDDLCPEIAGTERLSLTLDAELCENACVCTAEEYEDACTCS